MRRVYLRLFSIVNRPCRLSTLNTTTTLTSFRVELKLSLATTCPYIFLAKLPFPEGPKIANSKITNARRVADGQKPRGERKLKSKAGSHGDENSEPPWKESERKRRETFRFMNDRNLNCFSSSPAEGNRREEGRWAKFSFLLINPNTL